MDAARQSPATSPADMARCRAWAERHLARAEDLPLALVYDGQPVRGIPAGWRPTARSRRIDANITETVYEGRDPATGLTVRVECATYHDYPVVEWVAWFTNTGDRATPMLSDILALDAVLADSAPDRQVPVGAAPVLQHSNGDSNDPEGYTPLETALPAGEELALAPAGGRPSDRAFPYFRIVIRRRRRLAGHRLAGPVGGELRRARRRRRTCARARSAPICACCRARPSARRA